LFLSLLILSTTKLEIGFCQVSRGSGGEGGGGGEKEGVGGKGGVGGGWRNDPNIVCTYE
jgi:hypothetical protein